MDEKIYKVTLADGTELAGLSMNGNNFISAVPVDADIFTANCSPVAISDGEKEEIHEHMELVQVTVWRSFWESLAPTWQIDAPIQETEVSKRDSAPSAVNSKICSASDADRLMIYRSCSGEIRAVTPSIGRMASYSFFQNSGCGFPPIGW